MGHTGSKFTVNAVQAIKTGNTKKLRALLGEFKQFIDSQDQEGNTLLKIAVVNSQVNIVRALLDEGADINAPDKSGLICLHTAVDLGNKDIVQLLVERGSYVNGRNENYETPLSVSVAKRNMHIVNVLLDKFANVNITDSFGNAPLHVAVANGDYEMCKLLLEKGKDTDLDLQNIEGYTPLMLGLINSHESICSLLCEHGSDGSVVGGDGLAPILLAAQKKYQSVVSSFIRQNVDVNVQDKSHNTALVYALENKCLTMAQELIAAGADVRSTENKKSPLHLAAELGAKEIVDSILDGGVDVNILDSDDDSALVVAVRNQHEDVSRLLIERGAQKEDLYKAMRAATMKCNKNLIKIVLVAMDTDQVVQFLLQVGSALEDGGAGKGADDEDKTCIVCFESSRDAVCVPCGHASCCSNCLEGFPDPKLCPICRVPVQHVQRIYRV